MTRTDAWNVLTPSTGLLSNFLEGEFPALLTPSMSTNPNTPNAAFGIEAIQVE